MRRRVKIGKAFDLSVSENEDPNNGQSKLLPKRVTVGREFEAKITSPKDWVEVNESVMRTRMTWAVLGAVGTFLLGAAGLGIYKGEFGALQYVWSVAGPIYGGIAGYFYHRQHKK